MRTLLFTLLVGLSACSNDSVLDNLDQPAQAMSDGIPSLTVDQVEQELGANQLVAIDCNSPGTRKKYGILPGATLVDDSETIVASQLPANRDTKLVFYCSKES